MDYDTSDDNVTKLPFDETLLHEDSENDENLPRKSYRDGPKQPTIFNKILRPFQTCCASYKVMKRPTEVIDVIAADHITLSDSNTSENDENEEDNHLLNIFKSNKKTSPEVINKELIISHGFKWSHLPSTTIIDATALWLIPLSLQELFARTDYESLESCIFPFICMNWCLFLEMGRRFDNEMIIDAIENSKGSIDSSKDRNTKIQQGLKKAQMNGIFQNIQEIESRLIQEVMGQLYTLVDYVKLNPTNCVYMVITHARSVAISCHSQSDFLNLRIFDTGISKERGPALLGFDTPKVVEDYLLELYSTDGYVAESKQTFMTWTFMSPSGSRSPPYENVNSLNKIICLQTEMNLSAARQSSSFNNLDPITGAMQAVTDATNFRIKDELLFTQSAAGNIRVSGKSKKKNHNL